MMWQVEDALEGRLSVGQSRGGQGEKEYVLRLSGKRFFQLQKFLEEAAVAPGNFFHARMAVTLWEALRAGVISSGDFESDKQVVGATPRE